MKTTVIITGHMRTFARCLPSQRWQVFRHLPNPTFVVSAVDDEDANSAGALLHAFPSATVHIERVTQPELPEPPLSLAAHAPYAISVPVQAVLRQLWHLQRGYAFAGECGALDGAEAVIRCRPDIHFQTGVEFGELWEGRKDLPGSSSICVVTPFPANTCFVPWWGCFGGINDRFAIMGREAAESYFNAFRAIDTLLRMGCPLHPESLIAGALELTSATISRTLPTMFATVRKDGQSRHPEILPHEIAEYARA